MKKAEFIACLRDAPDKKLQPIYQLYFHAMQQLSFFYKRLVVYELHEVVDIKAESMVAATMVNFLRKHCFAKDLICELNESDIDTAYNLYIKTKQHFHESRNFQVAVISALNAKKIESSEINRKLVKYYVLEE